MNPVSPVRIVYNTCAKKCCVESADHDLVELVAAARQTIVFTDRRFLLTVLSVLLDPGF